MPESGVLPLIREIAAHGLAPQEHPEIVSVPPEEGPALLRTISTNRLTGIAVAAVQDGWLELAPPDEAELLDRQRVAMMWAITLELRMLELADAFDAAGIPIVVLKGSALAQCFYPDPSWRPFSDLDLLVRTRTGSGRARSCTISGSGGTFPSRGPDSTSGSARRPVTPTMPAGRSTCIAPSCWGRTGSAWIWTTSSAVPRDSWSAASGCDASTTPPP